VGFSRCPGGLSTPGTPLPLVLTATILCQMSDTSDMSDRPVQIVRRWIDAYYAMRDDEVEAMADAEIQIRPRVGHGARLYEGMSGLRAWLEYTRAARSVIVDYSTELLPDGRVLAESTLEGVPVLALFELRADAVARVTMYISDRTMLERLGEIAASDGDVGVGGP
jgi:hypothetical protein